MSALTAHIAVNAYMTPRIWIVYAKCIHVMQNADTVPVSPPFNAAVRR